MDLFLKVVESLVIGAVFVIMVYFSNELIVWFKSMGRNRGFEKISDEQWTKDVFSAFNDYRYVISLFEHDNNNIPLPKRATSHSAGYDVFSPFSFELKPNEEIKIPTGFNAYMRDNEKLIFHTRSGNGFKYIRLSNCTGVGDSDYFLNENNEGHYWVKLRNEGTKVFIVNVGDAVAQCIFEDYKLADGDSYTGNKRVGGFGSTDKK